MRHTIRRKWKLGRRTDKDLSDLSHMFDPILRGWIGYYGRFYRSEMTNALQTINFALVKWAQRKYRHLKGHRTRAARWLGGVARREPTLFAHWHLLKMQPAER
jgi:RNA-directed DNA polymerase